MPLPETSIPDFPDGGLLQPTDILPLQRFESGVWVDYRTTAARINGNVKLAVIDWDMSINLNEAITADTPGNYLLFLSAFATFEPGALTPGTGADILMTSPTSSSGCAYVIPFIAGSDKYVTISAPLADPTTDIYDGLDSDLNLNVVVVPGTFDSTMRIVVQYVEIEPV